MGMVNFETHLAVWYGHLAPYMRKALETFERELAEHAELSKQIDSATSSREQLARLSKEERDRMGKQIEERGRCDLSHCLVRPIALMNDYYIAAWLPSGSKSGWGDDNEHRRLAERFRTLAVGSGAHVLRAWDFDLGEGHGVEKYAQTEEEYIEMTRTKP